MIYLDHNATSPLHPAARAAMMPWLEGQAGNPSSIHGAGRRARAAIDQARAEVAALIGETDPRNIHFTSGGTEADNQALRAPWPTGRELAGRLVVSAVEHPAVAEQTRALERAGLAVDRLGVDALGRLRGPNLAPDTRLVSVMAANNETGNLYDLAELSRAARGVGALLHTDAVQAAGKIPLDLPATGADMASVSAHKLGGPQGVGALWARAGLEIPPLLWGGAQEEGRRSGTQNVAGIVGFGAAARVAAEELEARAERLRRLRDRYEEIVCAGVPGARVLGDPDRRLPNTSCMSLPGVTGEAVLMRADVAGVALSTGSACTSGRGKPSAVLLAMGLPPSWIQGALRMSAGWDTTDEHVEAAARVVVEAVRALQAVSGERHHVQR